MKLSVLVVDDEPIARQAITRLLRDDADVEHMAECGDGASAVQAIRSRSPDLVFLDIQMPAMTGLDVVAAIGAERMPAIVFVTAFEQYAVRAFEANAVDYLVKPFGRERFSHALARRKGVWPTVVRARRCRVGSCRRWNPCVVATSISIASRCAKASRSPSSRCRTSSGSTPAATRY